MSLHMRGFIEYIYKGENMYKKNEKSNEYNRKRSRIFRWSIWLFTALICFSGCGKETDQETKQMEEVYVEEAKSDKPQSGKQPEESQKGQKAGAFEEEQELQAEEQDQEGQKRTEEQEAKEQTGTIWVYVSGAVCQPGVYELPEGSRLFEALERAGGMTETADPDFLNQAELLVDGVQIKVPTKEEVASGIAEKAAPDNPGTSAESGGAPGGKVNLNTATKEELMTLPGIGEAKADSILTYRESAGGFQSIEQIKEIEGIKDGVFEKIKELIAV